MASNASRGARAKGRTKAYLEAIGYQVADLEVVRWIQSPRGRVPVKRDQFGADLLAMNHLEIVLVQVKSGAVALAGTFPDARREFERFKFPPGVRRFVIAWPPRAREPRLLELSGRGSFVVHSSTDRRQHGKAKDRKPETVKEAGAETSGTEKADRPRRPIVGTEARSKGRSQRTAVADTPRHGADPKRQAR